MSIPLDIGTKLLFKTGVGDLKKAPVTLRYSIKSFKKQLNAANELKRQPNIYY